jgi:bud site selection protein 20
MNEHKRSKLHKKRIRQLKDEPYSQAEAEAAAGLGSYPLKRKSTGEDQDADQVQEKRIKVE